MRAHGSTRWLVCILGSAVIVASSCTEYQSSHQSSIEGPCIILCFVVREPFGLGERMLRVSSPLRKVSRSLYTQSRMPLHHLMIGTWTPPGAIFTVAFDDEKLTLELVKRTEIPQDEPISWMTFDVSPRDPFPSSRSSLTPSPPRSMPRRTSMERP